MSFNDEIRRAAGRTVSVAPAAGPTGDFGIGQGQSARPTPPPPVGMNALIRGHYAERHERRAELARSFE